MSFVCVYQLLTFYCMFWVFVVSQFINNLTFYNISYSMLSYFKLIAIIADGCEPQANGTAR